MTRFASAIGLLCLTVSSPAMAMPNAFWIFGFHVPAKQGPRSDIVMTKPKSAPATQSALLAKVDATSYREPGADR